METDTHQAELRDSTALKSVESILVKAKSRGIGIEVDSVETFKFAKSPR